MNRPGVARDEVGGETDLTGIATVDLPAALGDLHDSLPVGARVTLLLPRAAIGRCDDLLTGAGFDEPLVMASRRAVFAGATRARTLADRVGPGMRVLVCGLNPSLYAADAGIGFARPGNRFWPAVLAAGLATVDRDPAHALRHHGLGLTDLVKRASVGADEVRAEEYRAGLGRVERLVAWLQPGVVCFVGLAGWRAVVDRRAAAGPQDALLGGRPTYLAPSTSGRNASSRPADLVAHLRAAAALAG